MTIRVPAPTRDLIDIAICAAAQARPWLKLARKSVGKTDNGYIADLEFVG